ncbi:MAG: zinc-ribbon domain-containing protein [Desulfobacterales bacterium]|nr:zinc-ribbon domain-containing protein [Desulfobacterales bacterium]
MTVICEECGKVYHIDPDKLEQYSDKSVRVRCGECGHVTQLSKLLETTEPPAESPAETYEEPSYEEPSYAGPEEGEPYTEEPAPELGTEPEPGPEPEETAEPAGTGAGAPERPAGETSRGWIGIRGKMFFLFLVIPVILMAASGYFSQMQLENLASNITDKSTELVAESGKEKLLQKAKDVALQCEIYLKANPHLKPEDFAYDAQFSQIAVQAVGKTGYTCVIEEEIEDRDSIIWAHPNENLVGIPDINVLRKALGPYFDEFYAILEKSWGRNISTGPYMWKDTDGNLREKYMAIVPIEVEGRRPLSVLATAYMDEFTRKTAGLEEDAQQMTMQTRNINLGILAGAIVIIGLCIIIYGYRLSRRIQYLTEAADRISVGDLEAEIEVRSKDEIGSLADAISRMQDSLRFSIERLRRRR